MLGKNQFSVGEYVVLPARARQNGDAEAELFFDGGRETRSARLVVSSNAIFDFDLHRQIMGARPLKINGHRAPPTAHSQQPTVSDSFLHS